MKVKTSITLSEEVLRAIDLAVKGSANRSGFIEQAVRSYLRQNAREQRDAGDLEILNSNALKLNKEAADVLSYQVDL